MNILSKQIHKKIIEHEVVCNSSKGVLSQQYYQLLRFPEVLCHISTYKGKKKLYFLHTIGLSMMISIVAVVYNGVV
jgi:hypothetical protein